MRKAITQEEAGKRMLNCCKGVLLGGGTALLLCGVLLAGAAAGISQGLLSGEIRYQITVVCSVIGSFIGTVFATRMSPIKSGVLAGLAVGGTFFLLLLSFGVIFYDTVSFENGGLGLLCASLCGGAAAGLLVGHQKPKGGRKRHIR